MAASVMIKNKDQQVKPIEKLFYAYAPLIACTLLIPATSTFAMTALLVVTCVNILKQQKFAKLYKNKDTYNPIIGYIGIFFFCFMSFYGIPAATTMLHAQLGISQLLLKIILISWSLDQSSGLFSESNISVLKSLLMLPSQSTIISLNKIMLLTIAFTFAITTLQLPTISALIFGYLAIKLIPLAIDQPIRLLAILHPHQHTTDDKSFHIDDKKSAIRTIMEILFLPLQMIGQIIFWPHPHTRDNSLDLALHAIPFIMFALSGMPILIPSIIPWRIALALSGVSRIGKYRKNFNLAINSYIYECHAQHDNRHLQIQKDINNDIINDVISHFPAYKT